MPELNLIPFFRKPSATWDNVELARRRFITDDPSFTGVMCPGNYLDMLNVIECHGPLRTNGFVVEFTTPQRLIVFCDVCGFLGTIYA